MNIYGKKVKFFAIVLIMLISICNFAAIMSDNDKTAFITKAEFESLKADFENQINGYNHNMDNKIDGAILSYLANFNLTKKPENYWSKLMQNTNNDFWWINSWNTGTEHLTPNVIANITRELYILSYKARGYGWWPSGWNSDGSIANMRHWLWGASGESNFDFSGKFGVGGRTDTMTSTGTSNTITAGTNKINQEKNVGTQTIDGVGSRWIMHRQPNGELVIRKFSQNYYPIILVDVWDHIYYNIRETGSATNITKTYYNDGARSYKTTGSGTVPTLTSFGKTTNGVTKQTGSSSTNANYIEVNMMLNDVSDNINYENRVIWGDDVNNTIYYSLDTALPERDTSVPAQVITLPKSQFNDIYHTSNQEKVQRNEIYGYDLTYHHYNVQYGSMSLGGCQNTVVSNTIGEIVKLAQGVKIVENSNDEQVLKFKIKFKSNPNEGEVTYIIADKKFNEDGTVAVGATTVKSETVAVGTEITFDYNAKPKQEYWINLRSTVTGREATIESFSIDGAN